MASFFHPVGPLPPSVYWRRRAVVLGIPLVLIIAVAYSCSGSNPAPAAHTSGLPTAGSTPTGVITPSIMPTGSPPPANSYPTAPTGTSTGISPGGSGTTPNGGATGTQGAGTGTTGTGSSTCELALTLALDKTATNGTDTFPSGQNPTFDAAAENNGTGNCLLGTGIVLTVTEPGQSGTMWTNATCSTAPAALAVGPGGEPNRVPETIEWPVFQSVTGCQTSTQGPHSGTFTVVASANGVSSDPVTFTVG